MAKYYVVNINYDAITQRIYAKQGSHSHEKSNQLSKDGMAYFSTPENKNTVSATGFRSSVSDPGEGLEFKWNDSEKKWQP